MNEKQETALAIPEEKNALVSVSVASAEEVIETASGIAQKLSKIVKDCNLIVNFRGKKHVRCEGWTTLASLLGYSVGVFRDGIKEKEEDKEVVMEVEREIGGKKYVKKVVVRPYTVSATAYLMKGGNVISTAEAECSNLEKNWCDKERFAIKSMAQTRAVAKVCRIQLGWVMALAREFELTPAEEIDFMEAEVEEESPKETKEDLANDNLVKEVEGAMKYLLQKEKEGVQLSAKLKEFMDRLRISELTKEQLVKARDYLNYWVVRI